MEKKLYSATTQMSPVIYKDFYKLYYSERLKAFNIISRIIGIIMIIAAFFMYRRDFGIVWTLIALWIGAFLVVYPNLAYRKPYKRAKNQKQVTHFAFYETYVAEKTNSKSTDYNYSDLMKVVETGKYILIYHTVESVSIVVKSEVQEGYEPLIEFLKSKVEYKKMR